MAAGNVTVTLTALEIGPGLSTTAIITDAESVNFRFKDGAVDVKKESGATTTVQYSNVATVTINPSAKTVAIS